MPFTINNWKEALYPLIEDYFTDQLDKNDAIIGQLITVEGTDKYETTKESLGGLGEVPDYNGTEIKQMNRAKGFTNSIITKEKAGLYQVHFKAAKLDMSGEAKKAGTYMSNALNATRLKMFNTFMSNLFNPTQKWADGKAIFSTGHKVNPSVTDTYDNLITDDLTIAALTKMEKAMARWKTYDGMDLVINPNLLLVSPELAPTCRQLFSDRAELLPASANNDANPFYETQWKPVKGFGAKQWAYVDKALMKEYISLLDTTKPMVIRQKNSNPLIDEYIGYMDSAIGCYEVKFGMGANPA
jgi:phage major head subunit gpT-like protein